MLFLARPAVCPGVTVCTHSGGRGGPALTGNTLKAPPHPLHTLPHLSLSGAAPAPEWMFARLREPVFIFILFLSYFEVALEEHSAALETSLIT